MADARAKHTLSMLLVGVVAGAGIVQLLPRDNTEQRSDPTTSVVESVESQQVADASLERPAQSEPASDWRGDATGADPVDLPDGAEFTSREELETVLSPSIVRVLISEQAVLYVSESSEVVTDAP